MFSANHNHTRMRAKALGKLMTGTTFGYPMAFRLSQGMGQQEILRKTFRKVLDNLQKSLGKVAEILRITDRKVLDF